MASLRVQLADLLAAAPGAAPIDLAATAWFVEESWEEIQEVEQAFTQKFRALLPEFIELLGEPKWNLPENRDWFDQWWAETIDAAAWDLDERVLCLAVWHQDKETPILLTIRCLTKTELAELTADSW